MSSHLEESIFGDADRVDARGRFHRRRRPGGPRRPRHLLRRWLTILVALAVLALAAYGSVQFIRPIYDKLTAEKDYPGPGTGVAKVVINQGDTGRMIGTTLEKAEVVRTAKAFVDAEVANTKAAASIQPGTYTLKKQMKAADALVALTDAKNRTVAGVRVREGLWASEIYPILARATGQPVAAYVTAAKDPVALGLPAGAHGNIEGYLFPDTYQFPDKATAAQQLAIMVKSGVAHLHKAGVSDAAMERTLIIASIVEAEVNQPADRAKVAGVIEKRLADPTGPTAGLLQLDSTVSYGVKRRSLTTTDAERANPNKWNTYVHKGLPAGPISNPGFASMQAAAHPVAGPWYFWLTVNPAKGHTEFSVTYAEHQQQQKAFQAWCQSQKKGTCS